MNAAHHHRHVHSRAACVSKLSKGVIGGVTCGGRQGGLNTMPHSWCQQGTASQNRLSHRRTVVSAVDPDKLGIVRTEELRDGSIMFCFGDEADASSSSSAAADAAMAAGVSDKAAAEAATAGQEVSEVAGSSAAAPESTATAAAEGDAPAQQAAQVTAAAEVSSLDDDPHTEEADAGGSQPQSIDKAQLHDLKVAELKELARENELHGYSTMRKTELVDFLAEALPGDYQI